MTNAPNDTRHWGSRLDALLGWGLALLLILGTVLLGAGDAEAHQRAVAPLPYVGVLSATEQGGDLTVAYGIERQAGASSWEVIPDDFGATVQLHYIGNGAGEGGRWDAAPPSTQRVEGIVVTPVAGIPTWDLVRVVVRIDGRDVTSAGQPVEAPACEVAA
jgi:hypothetical protein